MCRKELSVATSQVGEAAPGWAFNKKIIITALKDVVTMQQNHIHKMLHKWWVYLCEGQKDLASFLSLVHLL